ncbi:YbjN domain-containing protein [Micromonospora sp. WMMD882]|uniref:YbjN domain-containing protein n=1 Tax=Micromonospora sp. WMMD882 TaxID=3015151 RepID=UPI00248C1B65|nr:YbjN domain-containing protein [Micromonospora sp. WMMD882]WBB81847.1 YbjN domain-containing protein [Micromonospora sp. WMMD882]
MTGDVDAWADALAAARDRPDDAAKIAELERIAGHADATGQVRLGVDARFALVETYRFHGEPGRSAGPVRHLLAALDHSPALFSAGDVALLRRCQRTAVEAAAASPQVTLVEARALLDDLVTRLDGDEPGVPAELGCRLADQLGDSSTARERFDRWRAAGPGPDCPACVAVRQAELLTGWGEWAEAARVLDRALAGPGSCPEQPEAALAAALLPYLRLGRYDEAGRAHLRAYRRHRRSAAGFGRLPAHLTFCALGGYLTRGLTILVEQLPRLARPTDERSAMEFAAAGALLCRLAGESGLTRTPVPPGPAVAAAEPTGPDAPQGPTGPVRSAGTTGPGGPAETAGPSGPDQTIRPGRLPDGPAGLGHATRLAEAFGLIRPLRVDGGRDVAALGAELLATATDLAGRFDARNGTGHQSDRIVAWLAERPRPGIPAPLPTDPDEDPPEPAPGAGPGAPDAGSADGPAQLTVAMIVAAVERRGDTCAVDPAGTVVGRWGEAMIRFDRVGSRSEILHARVVATRRLPAARRPEAYEFVNAWNRDRLQPRAYVHEVADGELVLAGDLTTDLAYGVAPAQVAVLVDAAVTTGVAYADAVAALP